MYVDEKVSVEQKTNETPLIADGFVKCQENAPGKVKEPETVDDQIISSTKSDDVGEGDVSSVVEDTVHDLLIPDALITIDDALQNSSNGEEPLACVHESSIDQEMKMLEYLFCISEEMNLQAEKQVSLAKEFSLNLSRLLEEMNVRKLK